MKVSIRIVYVCTQVSCISLLTFWVDGIVKVEKWSILLKKLTYVDQALMKYNIMIDYEIARKNSYWIIAGLLVQMFLPYISNLLHLNLKDFQLLLVFGLPHSGIITMCSIIILMIGIIKRRLESLNGLLKELTGCNLDEISTIEGKNQEKPLAILCHVCMWHHNIIKLVNLTNETFGFRLVVIFGYSFVIMVTDIFSICRMFSAGFKFISFAGSVLMTLCYAFNVYNICRVCEYTVKEAKRSGLLIHQIETSDFDMKDEIEMFSLQMANEEMEFNAAGFFPVNYSLLFSIIGGVTTYIIILIQLENSSPKSVEEMISTTVESMANITNH